MDKRYEKKSDGDTWMLGWSKEDASWKAKEREATAEAKERLERSRNLCDLWGHWHHSNPTDANSQRRSQEPSIHEALKNSYY